MTEDTPRQLVLVCTQNCFCLSSDRSGLIHPYLSLGRNTQAESSVIWLALLPQIRGMAGENRSKSGIKDSV